MKIIEIIATTGNKFHFAGSPNNQKIYRRKLAIQNADRIDNEIRITFDSVEKDKLNDFVNRINYNGGSDSYYLHFLTDNKWIESRIFEDETDLVVNFLVFQENKMISGDILDI